MSKSQFEEVFGFREPTRAEVEGAADDMSFKFQNDGDPVGTAAFFSAEGSKVSVWSSLYKQLNKMNYLQAMKRK